jgi:hypothetical protein
MFWVAYSSAIVAPVGRGALFDASALVTVAFTGLGAPLVRSAQPRYAGHSHFSLCESRAET